MPVNCNMSIDYWLNLHKFCHQGMNEAESFPKTRCGRKEMLA